MYLVLLGPPGAGKGTQAERLEKELKLPHVASGDLFRENLRNETELGLLAKTYMDKGELVPDDVTIAMVRDRLQRPDCDQGAILDGFPRTHPQAQSLDTMLADMGRKLDGVLYIAAPRRGVSAPAVGPLDLSAVPDALSHHVQSTGPGGSVRRLWWGALSAGRRQAGDSASSPQGLSPADGDSH